MHALILAWILVGAHTPATVSLSFREAWEEAQRSNPELLAARRSAQLARLQLWQQASDLLPWPTFSLEYTDKSYSTGGGRALPPALIRYGASQQGYTEILSARVTLFSPSWVEGWIRQHAAARVAEVRLEDQRAKLRLELVKAYARAYRAQEERILREKQLEKERWSLQQALRRMELGQGSRLDVLNARVRVGQAEEQQVRAQQEWRQALADLARIMGHSEPEPWKLLPVQVESLHVDTLAIRERVLRAERTLRIQRVQAGAARLRSWWSWVSVLPDVTYSWEWYRTTGSGPALDAFWNDASFTRGWSVSLTFPLGRYVFGNAQTRVEAAMEQARLRAVRLQTLKNVEDHLARWVTLMQRKDVLEVTLKQAEEAEHLAETRYRLGSLSLEDLFDARNRRLEVALQLLQVRLDLWIEWETLFDLTGGKP